MCSKVLVLDSDSKISLLSSKHNVKCVFLTKATHNKGIHTSGKFKQQQNIMILWTAVAEVKEKYWSKNKIKQSLLKV